MSDPSTPEHGDSKTESAPQGKQSACTYDEAVELTGHGSYNYLFLATCSIISNAVALDMFGISVVTAAARCDLELNIFTTGLLNSAPLAGTVLFAYPWGFYADRYGRRRALLLSTFGGFLLGALSSFAPDWRTMLVLKFIGCSFSAASYSLTFTYLGEGTGSKRRRKYMFIVNSANMAAELVFYGLAYFILPVNISIPLPLLGITIRSWRLYNFVLVTPLGISGFLLLSLYESPKILASVGKSDQALEVMKKIYRRNGGEGEYSVKALSVEHEATSRSNVSFWSALVKQAAPLFRPPLLWRTVQLYYLLSLGSATNNAFLMWYPMMVNLFFKSFSGGGGGSQSFCERIASNVTLDASDDDVNYVCDDSISSNTMYAGMLLGLTFTIINLIATAVASYRRLVLIACLLVSGTSLLLVENISEPVTNMVAFTMIQVIAVANGSVASYFVDLYPTACRGLVSSLSMIFMRIFSLASINIVGPLIVHHCSTTFYSWAVYVASGIVVALFLPSDKKDYK